MLHVYGSAYERGEAHGELLGVKLLDFTETALPNFFKEYVGELAQQIGTLPKWLQDIILKLLPYAEQEAPKIFDLALEYVELVQRKYNHGSLYDEMDGIAHGACAAAAKAGRSCDAAAYAKRLQKINMLPDLIRMQCSMLGAWGGASPGGSLVQLRALDFGGGPFANNSVLVVHHPSAPTTVAAHRPSAAAAAAAAAAATPPPQPFASLSFPGFVGVVTGFSPSVALSEKVNDVADGTPAPKGSYEGRSTSFVIRDMVERAPTKEAAHAIALNATRTWTVWLGVGDAASQRMLVIRYTRADAPAYNETTVPSLTGQPAIPDVVYVDKHPQPSTRDLTMPHALQRLRATPSSIGQGVSPPSATRRTRATSTSRCTISTRRNHRSSSRSARSTLTSPTLGRAAATRGRRHFCDLTKRRYGRSPSREERGFYY